MELSRGLVALITSGGWLIDPEFGLEALAIAQFNLDSGNVVQAETIHAFMSKDGKLQFGEDATGDLAYHEISGPMIYQDGPCTRGIESWVRNFQQIDGTAKGHLIRIHSGGGMATAGVAAYEAIRSASSPVVVWSDMAASGAYMAAAGAKEIIASSNMARFGSIGAMMSISREILDELQTKVLTLYARSSPDKNRELRSLLVGDTSPMIDHLDELDRGFMDIVKSERGLRSGRVLDRETMSGGVWTAKESKERGLVDGIGDRSYAIKRLLRYI